MVSVPALTIVYHPDLRRIGERAVLSGLLVGRQVALGRDEPSFAQPGHAPRHPLSAACISRTPIALEPLPDGGVRVRRGESRTRLDHRGAAAAGDLELSAEEVDRGVVLRLGGLVVVLLHHIAPGFVPSRETWGLLGDSDGIERVRRDVARVADLEVPVLLRGETGTGKEVAAHAVHQASARREGPFVAVNLGALAPELAAAELFGAERGSFTGAVKQQEGYFSAARGGTLFLDEVGEAPVALQAMLLRVLETSEIQRVGASRTQRVDVRVIAATDADLESRVADGSFRAPLYHRLSAFEICIPPLRERRDDIGRLLLTFLRAELERTGEADRLAPSDAPWLPASLVARLVDLDWPGNVRQLRNVARQLVLGGRGRDRIEITPAIERLLTGSGVGAGTRGPLPSSPSLPPGVAPPPVGSSPTPASGGAAPVSSSPTPAAAAPPPSPSWAPPAPSWTPPAPSFTPPPAPSWMPPPGPSWTPPPPSFPDAAGRRKPADITHEELVGALREHRWELSAAAEALRISRASMYVLVERNARLRRAGDLTPEELARSFHECGGDLARMVDRLEVSEKALRRRLRELGLI